MSRSVLFPLIALAGLVLYGTTQAAKPPQAPAPRVEIEDLAPRRVLAEPPAARPPKPAPPNERPDTKAPADTARAEPPAPPEQLL